ncbi:hypothetical protein A2645_00720 [Candidatus Nomurabacteria bacterium RIFCSPHIGHO2_01_FULL_39_9]|uniref:Uncharacterized protein n=1 Tax=Candidatus Nomurabacteria bacterium RIFCSPHIGHO2_01_FULL_39_9 TaxID=1801735 RepID=A0A1F6UW05_9BACT|nr:MAG: hypothetical protein A2645_00720 [Candidatus Nomurabacteria bacterium RIFCSPHIGHO2_01_FULL_39_9]
MGKQKISRVLLRRFISLWNKKHITLKKISIRLGLEYGRICSLYATAKREKKLEEREQGRPMTPLSKFDRRFIRAWNKKGLTLDEMSFKMKLPATKTSSIYVRLRKRDLLEDRGKGAKLKKIQEKKIIKLRQKGFSWKAIKEKLGLPLTEERVRQRFRNDDSVTGFQSPHALASELGVPYHVVRELSRGKAVKRARFMMLSKEVAKKIGHADRVKEYQCGKGRGICRQCGSDFEYEVIFISEKKCHKRGPMLQYCSEECRKTQKREAQRMENVLKKPMSKNIKRIKKHLDKIVFPENEEWLMQEDAMEVAGISRRTLFLLQKRGVITTRPDLEKISSRSGKPIRLYPKSTLLVVRHYYEKCRKGP